MKILHIEGGRNFYGGAQQILFLLEGLRSRGIESVLVCPVASELARRATAFAEVRDIPMRGDLDIALIPRIWRTIRAVRPDLVHIHSRIGADVMGGLAARLSGVPVVYSRRVDNPESSLAIALKYRLFDRVVAISEAIQRIKLAEGLPAEKLRCVHSVVDPAPFQGACDAKWFREEFHLPEAGPVVAMVAQMIARKGHRFMLEAMPQLVERHPALRLVLFGKGVLESELRRVAQTSGLSEQVCFAGFREDLPRILPCLNVLVHPALTEGLGVSLLQAASAGVPIVAFRAGGVPEVVRDGVNGLLVEPGDVPGLASACLRLLDDPGMARRMGLAGRALVEREFSTDQMVEGNLAVYRELLADRN